MASSSPLLSSWSKLFIAVGTYDGALAGWELQNNMDSSLIVNESKQKTKDNKTKQLTLTFATACHDGSVRCLCFSSPSTSSSSLPSTNHDALTDTTISSPETYCNILLLPGALLSCGFDEMLRTHDWSKRKTSLGEVRTPSDFGTPLCASFAPPPPPPALLIPSTTTTTVGLTTSTASLNSSSSSTHCLVGFSEGKIVIYKKRDWSVQHVLAGHDGGVSSLAVHPSGKLALSGGLSDGKLKLWDLTKGRLAYATQVVVASSSKQPQSQPQRRVIVPPAVQSLVWSPDGMAYGFCHGTHITVRHVDTGQDLLDVDDMPSRVNQMALLSVPEGLFVAAACEDGSLPVLEVVQQPLSSTSSSATISGANGDNEKRTIIRRAIMAIEPVNAAVAREERFKCIQVVSDYHVVTANSAGVVSLMSLKGAIQMITKPEEDDQNKDDDEQDMEDDDDDDDKVQPRQSKRGQQANDEDDDDDEEEELAVEIIDSVQLGHGSRITCLAVWAQPVESQTPDESNMLSVPTVEEEEENQNENSNKNDDVKDTCNDDPNEEALEDKRRRPSSNMDMDSATIKKARELVTQAKELQRKRDKKRRKKQRKA